jgi:hypothetical protein
MTAVFLRCAIVIATAGIALLSAPAGAFGQEQECPVPERFYAFEPPLTKTAKALASGQEVVIAALGGASTVGLAAGGPNLAWPARMSSVLAAKFPSARTKIINLALARQTAKAAVERFSRDVFPLKPTLVIWETGTMEAVRGTDVDEFRETVQAGINELHTARTEMVLMNMQFSRETDAMIQFGPYLIAMRELADANDVPLFRRHGIMRYWAENDFLDLRTREAEKRRQVAAKLYDCIGHAMADFVARGVAAAKAASGPGSDR